VEGNSHFQGLAVPAETYLKVAASTFLFYKPLCGFVVLLRVTECSHTVGEYKGSSVRFLWNYTQAEASYPDTYQSV
jgi:hypothetical protein